MTIHQRIQVLTLSLFAVLAACEDEEMHHPDATLPADAAAFDGGSVAFDLALARELPADSAQRFVEVGAEAKIQSVATERLRSSGKLREGVSVTVSIDEFRLRTKRQVTWGGMMAGGDFIGAMVAVHENGKVLTNVKVTAVSIRGSVVGADEEERLDRLVDELATNIAAVL
jgi:hypothetical protein